MPKLIDHETRAVEITQAAWRVLVREGVAAVSVRRVAEEAGVATASLRRAFPRQADLLAACLDLMAHRVATRMAQLPPREPVPWAMAALAETMPLDDERRTEMAVYVTLGATALSDPALKAAFGRVRAGLGQLATAVVGHVAPHLTSADREAARAHLVALVDGLALGILHGQDEQEAIDILDRHLHSLARIHPDPSAAS